MHETSEPRIRDLRLARLGAAIAVLAVCIPLLIWGIWPAAREQHVLLISPTQMTLPRPASSLPEPVVLSATTQLEHSIWQNADTSPPTIPEYRRLLLEFPARMRKGDLAIICLTFEVDSAAGPPLTAAAGDNHGPTSIEPMQNVFKSHNVVAEAQVDLPGLEIRPPGPVREPLLPGESATFRWSLLQNASGRYRGTVWLFLIFVDKATGEQLRKPISAQSLQIEARTFMDLTGESARVAGGLGCLVGAVLAFPFASDIAKRIRLPIRARGH